MWMHFLVKSIVLAIFLSSQISLLMLALNVVAHVCNTIIVHRYSFFNRPQQKGNQHCIKIIFIMINFFLLLMFGLTACCTGSYWKNGKPLSLNQHIGTNVLWRFWALCGMLCGRGNFFLCYNIFFAFFHHWWSKRGAPQRGCLKIINFKNLFFHNALQCFLPNNLVHRL